MFEKEQQQLEEGGVGEKLKSTTLWPRLVFSSARRIGCYLRQGGTSTVWVGALSTLVAVLEYLCADLESANAARDNKRMVSSPATLPGGQERRTQQALA
jgi:hypothetical protein